jgi:signal transduction histidine kinase
MEPNDVLTCHGAEGTIGANCQMPVWMRRGQESKERAFCNSRWKILELAQSIEPQLAEKQIRLDIQLDDAANEAFADGERVEQILLNLLSNAAKFTSPGGVISIRSVVREQMIDVLVADTGIGIPHDKLEEVFESFMQISPSIGKAGGTGLGLAISRQLARAMGGELDAASALGQGSTFTLCLPRVSSKAATDFLFI